MILKREREREREREVQRKGKCENLGRWPRQIETDRTEKGNREKQ